MAIAPTVLSETAQIVALLGSPKALRGVHDQIDKLLEAVRRGLPTSTVDALADSLGVQRTAVADLANVSIRTLTRKRDGVLDATASDRVMRVARILAFATRVLGSRENAARWMNTPNRALNAVPPIALLDTDLGTQEVEAVLGRIVHGVFS
jgi:putative toxin-antitoxin system antitoxin component (TIGR02293 family)